MKIEKFQIITETIHGNRSTGGGILVLEQESADTFVVVSSGYLPSKSFDKFLLKPYDPAEAPIEFSLVGELTTNEWPTDPPPHVYRIKLELPATDAV